MRQRRAREMESLAERQRLGHSRDVGPGGGTTGLEQRAAGPAAAAPAGEGEAPNEYLCPITMDVMHDPVLAMDGHSYERTAIEKWLRTSQKSPKTNALLPSKMLLLNHALRAMIIEWRERRAAHGC